MLDKKIAYVMTRSVAPLTLEDISKRANEGGPLTKLTFTDQGSALALFGSYCASAESGCVQLFNVSEATVIGSLNISTGESL